MTDGRTALDYWTAHQQECVTKSVTVGTFVVTIPHGRAVIAAHSSEADNA
jgi:hypothetical protein